MKVFSSLKTKSFREFRDLAVGKRRARRHGGFATGCSDSLAALATTDECIVLKPSGHEVIWFDTKLDECFPSHGLAEQFKRHMLHAAKEFFRSIK